MDLLGLRDKVPIWLISISRKPGRNASYDFNYLVSPLVITPHHVSAAEADRSAKGKPATKTDFVLTIKDNLISLEAKDASLKEILEEIGRRMKVDVVAGIPDSWVQTSHVRYPEDTTGKDYGKSNVIVKGPTLFSHDEWGQEGNNHLSFYKGDLPCRPSYIRLL
jgi:hypothetical protein